MEDQPERVEYLHGRRPGDFYIRRPAMLRHGLRRVLGVPALFSSAYGNVGSSIYYALAVVAAWTLGLTPLVFLFAGGLFALTALSYAEATSAIPEAGGSSSFARRAFNEFASFVAGWGLMLDYIITIGISAFSVPNYLAVFWAPLKTWPWNSVGGILLVAMLAYVNLIGIKESAGLNIVLAILDLVTQSLIAIIGAWVLLNPSILLGNIHLGIAPTWGQLIYGISLSMLAYTGIETVSNMAEETRNPGETVPKSITYVVITVVFVYVLMSVIGLSAMPVVNEPNTTTGGAWTTPLAEEWKLDAVMGIVQTMPEVMRNPMGFWVGILAATILLIGANAGILGISRLTYSMAVHKQVPTVLGQIHRRYRTPWVAILLFAVMAALMIAPGKIDLLADLYSFGAMLSFTFAHISVIALRYKEPNLNRPYRAPLNVLFLGRSIPLTAVFGGLGTFSVWLIVTSTHSLVWYIGIPWMILGLILYLYYRHRLGLSLTKTVVAPPVRPIRQREAEQQRGTGPRQS